jgi:hypothetical protein
VMSLRGAPFVTKQSPGNGEIAYPTGTMSGFALATLPKSGGAMT